MPETALYDIYEHDVRSPHERQHRSQTHRWPGRQYSGRHRSGPHRHRETHPAREEMDHLRRGQLRVRAAVHRGDSDLREIADARGRQHRVGLGLRADHRIAGHRAAHAAARLDCRRAGHENQVLPRLLRHRRRHVLRDGASTDVAAVPGRVYPRDDRTQRLAHVLRFDADRHHAERTHGQGLLARLRLGLHRLDRAVHRVHRVDLRRPGAAIRLDDDRLHPRIVHHHRRLVGRVHDPADLQLPSGALPRHTRQAGNGRARHLPRAWRHLPQDSEEPSRCGCSCSRSSSTSMR